ncbi:glycosyltransferase [Arthrobacter sp. FW306-07-I]|uniref:glycosyltransferase n=1 Tax=Arthrobacter sp. FW306-07-I TaxID=2879622 RepID=UPI001F2661A6|nr:glycosyltransferase [Arthrobacter sp. FW306-07-I]UKA74588.1 glycosyltransferase [Arthrobacter sp. FW306-07-I]
MTDKPPSVVLLGFTVDDKKLFEIAQQSAILPTQTHRFAWNLVYALKSASLEVALLSVLPVPNHPEYPYKIIRSSVVEQDNVRGITLGFVNMLILKHATRFLACLSTGTRFIRYQDPETIVVHGVHTPFLVFARLVKKGLGRQICLVMTDPPGVVRAADGVISRVLKRLDRKLVRLLASGFDGIICLTPALAADFAPTVPALVLEGFANHELASLPSRSRQADSLFRIAYAGAINVEYGVENLVLAFMSMTDPDVRLHLYGKGPLDKWVLEQCKLDKRILHGGLVDHSALMPRLKEASVLINPRPAAQEFVRYSFPSKILEYMALGAPVITTRLAGLSADYLQYVQLTDDDSVAALARAIEAVRCQYPKAVERGLRGREYVLREKSVSNQGKRIAKFLSTLTGTRH